MNAVAATILWMSVQIALFSFVGVLAFLLLRRRGPNSAATCCATVLGLTLPLAVMVVCPWPRWSLGGAKPPVSDRGLNGGRGARATGAVDQNRELSTPAVPVASDTSISTFAIWWQTAVDWVGNGDEMQSTGAASQSNWQTSLPWLMASGLGYCLLRTVAGLWAMSRLRRNSRPIIDNGLQSALSEIIGKIDNIQSPAHPLTPSPAHPRPTRSGYVLEIRETADLRSAATIGWLRPVLLLPADWRSWTETERRVVLAHELAHVVRCDYLAGVIARLATSIHFYQPLVLWLSRQLRIQQELAADSHAAAVAGSRQMYLTTLAQLALRADEKPIPWAARAFLPGTSMLIKRVAWLKQSPDQKEMTMNQKTRWMLVVAMAAVALAVAGVRGPGGNDSTIGLVAQEAKPPAIGQSPKAAALERKPLRTFDYIPEDAKVVVAFSPSLLLKSATLQPLLKIAENAELDKTFGLPLSEIQDIKIVATGGGNLFESGPTSPFKRFIIRSVKPHDWKKWVAEKPGATPHQAGDKTFYSMGGEAEFFPDEHTVVVLPIRDENEVKKIVAGSEKLHSEDMSTFPALIYSPFAIWADTKYVKAELDKPGVPVDPMLLMLRSMLDGTKTASILANLSKPTADGGEEHVNFGLQLDCDSADAAKQSLALMQAARTLLKAVSATAEFEARRIVEQGPEDLRKLTELKLKLMQTASGILEKVNLKSEGNTATAVVDFGVPPALVTSLLQPAVVASREAALRTQGIINMKRIGLALHTFAAVRKHFPPAAIRDKDGKPLLSWRVAILPFLDDSSFGVANGGQALYKQFHLDEPWDSDHNKALIAKMPSVLRDPHEEAASTNASYFMPTGKGSIGENLEGTKPLDITDTASKTIMLIEAKRDIPWTKPDDIEIDPDPTKPLPKFGGHMPEGLFGVAFADGSVHAFSQAVVDANMLRALFTIAGGEPVALP